MLFQPNQSINQNAGIGDLGAQWLCKGISALCRNQSRDDPGGASGGGSGIRDLRLRGNNITHSGAKELAKLLSEDRCARDLRELDLSMNTITADGFRPLAVSLRGCRELVRLDVAGCRLGPGGVDAAADLIAAAGPRLRSVILTPKAEFADRVLGDRGGLAVALRQSLQRLADSLPFAGGVVEVGLGAFLRADPAAAASIEDALRERRERDGRAAGAGGGGGGAGAGEGGKRDTSSPAAGRGGSSSRSSEKSSRNANGGGGGGGGTSRLGSRTTRGDGSGTPLTVSAGGTRRTGASTPRAGGTATTPGSSSRSTPIRSREAGSSSRHGTRGTGIERPKAGKQPGTSERVRRGAAGPRSSPPTAGSASSSSASLHRASSKASMRAGAGGSGGKPSPLSSERSSRQQQQQQQQQHKTTAATLAAHDRAAAVQPAPHKRMHQGEELDSIDGFSPMVSRHALPPTPSSQRLLGSNPAHSRSGSRSFRAAGGGGGGGIDAGGGNHGAAGGGSGGGGGSGDVADSIADVVSKVMGDTAAMADDSESPPSVAPSTWEEDCAAVSAAAAAGRSRRTSGDSATSAGGLSSRGERGEGRKALSRKSSSASVRAVPDSSGRSTSKSAEHRGKGVAWRP